MLLNKENEESNPHLIFNVFFYAVERAFVMPNYFEQNKKNFGFGIKQYAFFKSVPPSSPKKNTQVTPMSRQCIHGSIETSTNNT